MNDKVYSLNGKIISKNERDKLLFLDESTRKVVTAEINNKTIPVGFIVKGKAQGIDLFLVVSDFQAEETTFTKETNARDWLKICAQIA